MVTVTITPETDLGAVIRQRRELAGKTQAELGRQVAEALGRPEPFMAPTVGAWERNRREPDRRTLAVIGQVLGVAFLIATTVIAGVAEAQRQERESEGVGEAPRAEGGPKSERPVP